MATYPIYPATSFQEAVDLTIFTSNQLSQVINEDATTEIETESGTIPSLRKALVDNFYFKDPIPWEEGSTETVFNQLRLFVDQEADTGWYYAPSATASNPVTMGITPQTDPAWVLYQLRTTETPTVAIKWEYIAIGGETTLSPPYAFNQGNIFLNGVFQTPDKAFSISNNVITLAEPLVAGDDVYALLGAFSLTVPDTYNNNFLIEKGNFVIGAVVSRAGDLLRYTSNGTTSWCKYLGTLPHTVATNTPVEDGGIYSDTNPSGLWVVIGEGSLINTINQVQQNLDDFKLGLANTTDLALGDSLIGVKQPYTLAINSTQHIKNQDILSVEDFGAIANGGVGDAHTNSYSFQKALTAVYTRGGGKVVLRGGTYYLDYPIYLRSNTELDLCGSTIIFLNPVFNKGRGGIVIGSSYEANRDTALAAYAAGTYPDATTNNPLYVNPTIKQYLRDNPSFLEAEHCRVHNGRLVAMHTVSGGRGGYGVNFVNSQHSYAYNLEFDGWTQAIGMGSDGTPETPSNHNCHAYDLVINTGDLTLTYYSIGFVSNSTACSITRAKQINPLTVGTANGSALATNYVEDCYFDNINVINLGRTASSEGLLLNNAKGCRASRISIGNAVSAVSTYYTDATFNDSSKPNHISDIYAVNCDYALSIRAKYAIVDNVSYLNVTGDVYWANNNASDNILNFTPQKMVFGGSNFPSTFLTLNTVKGWRYQYAYLRPSNMLINDRADTATVTSSKVVGTKAGVNLVFSYQLPSNMRAVNDVRMFLTFNTGSLTATSTMSITLRRMVAFDGNLGETPYVEMTNSRSSTSDVLQDTSLVAQVSGSTPGYVLAADTTHGLANAWELYITATNNVLNNYIKEARIGYWGD